MMDYFVKVKLYKNKLESDIVEFDTFFGRIPYSYGGGYEVTINWHLQEVNTHRTFYTD
jgi:hypothetical protein